MIKSDNIKDILETVRGTWPAASEKDIAFCILCDTIEDRSVAARLAYGLASKTAESRYDSENMKVLRDALRPFGVGALDEGAITREQNKTDLMQLLAKIKRAQSNGELEMRDALKMEADIRVKLNDKFDMDESDKKQHIIIVPQKHDYICPHTNRECSKMPSKEACIKFYNLKE